VHGVDLLGPDVELPSVVPALDPMSFERLRIACGWPSMAAELSGEVIPEECGLVPTAVSFTKGCFVGQELVARIDSRGANVPRHLRGVTAAALPRVGAEVLVDDRVVGELTSVVRLGRDGGLCLAYIHRSVEPPAEAVLTWGGAGSAATIHAVPLEPDAG
jgi:folate-binding protein YgfZ